MLVKSNKIAILLIIASVETNSGSGNKYVEIKSKPNGIIFKYPQGVEGEKGLGLCKINEACSVVHDRFWMAPLAERLCRCQNGLECPWQWDRHGPTTTMTNGNDTKTSLRFVHVNNRSVLQQCAVDKSRKACTRRQSAIVIRGRGQVDGKKSHVIARRVVLKCDCPQTHYWKLKKVVQKKNDKIMQVFQCAKQKRCKSLDFCGFVRADLYSTYYRCSCPREHLCMYENTTLEYVHELVYSGPAYRSHCYPFHHSTL